MPFPTWRLFFTCWIVYAVHWAPFMIREQFPALTLATSGTLNVERFLGWTPDIFRGPGGGAFINNNPGASILGAIPLLVARPVLDRVEEWNQRQAASAERALSASRYPAISAVEHRLEWYWMVVAFVTAAGLMAPASAAAIALLGRGLANAGIPRATAVAVSLLVGFGTPIFVRTGFLNHNLLVAHAGLLAALAIWWRGRQTLTPRRAAVSGVLAGYAVLCDYSGIVVLAAVGAYVWIHSGDGRARWRERVPVAAAYLTGASPMLAGLAVYQRWAFGTPALPSQHFMTAIDETSRGYRGISWPSASIAWSNFFDPQYGLFAVCPILVLSLAAPFVGGRYRLGRREMWLALAFFAGLTLFCSLNRYSPLQTSTGIRYLVPAIPGLMLLSLQVLQVLPRAVQLIASLSSVGIAWLSAVAHGSLRPLFSDPGQFQLSWLRRMAEYDRTVPAPRWSIVILALTCLLVMLVWYPEIWARKGRRTKGAPPLQSDAGSSAASAKSQL